MAGPRGFEPRSTVLETAILPLNYRPKKRNIFNNNIKITLKKASIEMGAVDRLRSESYETYNIAQKE